MASELELRTTKSFVIPSKARDLLFRWQHQYSMLLLETQVPRLNSTAE
jgi:hypothetical protein